MQKPTKEQLERQYCTEGHTFSELAVQYGVAVSTVYRWVTQAGIAIREPKKKTSTPTKEWLLHRHFVERITWKQIMEETGYSSAGLDALLRRYCIPRKPHHTVEKAVTPEQLYQWYVVEGLTAVRIGERINRHHSAVSRALRKLGFVQEKSMINQKRIPPIGKEELHTLYFLQRLSCATIGKMYGVRFSTVKKWLQDYELLPPSDSKRAKRTYTRKETASTRYGKEFNADERYRILSRDLWRCQMPGCGCAEKFRLEVHHIVPVIESGGHELSNGITLCRTCHFSIRQKESEYIPLFRQIITMQLAHMQTHYIGENQEAGNAEGTIQLAFEWTP